MRGEGTHCMTGSWAYAHRDTGNCIHGTTSDAGSNCKEPQKQDRQQYQYQPGIHAAPTETFLLDLSGGGAAPSTHIKYGYRCWMSHHPDPFSLTGCLIGSGVGDGACREDGADADVMLATWLTRCRLCCLTLLGVRM